MKPRPTSGLRRYAKIRPCLQLWPLAFGGTLVTSGCLMAAAWDGGGGDLNYATAANWNPDGVPTGAGAGADISVTATVTHNAASAFTTTGAAANLILGGATGVTTVLNVLPGSGTLTFGGNGYSTAAQIGAFQGNGTLNLSGGRVQIGTGLAGDDASINIATSTSGTAAATGAVNVSGGTLQVGRRILIAANATNRTGSLTLSGTGIINMVSTGLTGEGDLGMIRLGGGTVTLNFDGGELIGRGIRQDAAAALSRIYYNDTKFTLNGNETNNTASALIGSGGAAVNQIKNGGLRIDTAGFNGTIARGLANFTGHTGTLTKEGMGTLTITAAQSYTGTTTVSGGILAFSTTGNLPVGNAVTVGSGATLRFDRNDTFGNHVTAVSQAITVNGGTIANGGNFFTTLGAVTLNAGTINAIGGANANFPSFSLRGPITIGGSAASTLSGSGANSPMVVGTSLANSQTTFDVANATGDALSDLTVSVPLQGNRDALFVTVPTGIIKTGSGTMTLTAANTYTGATTITAGTLELGATGSLPTTSAVILNGGILLSNGVGNTADSLSLSAPTGSAIDLSGTSQLTFSAIDAASFDGRTLSIWNWTGTPGGGGTERLMVPDGRLNRAQLANISFFSGANGIGPLGTAAFSLTNPGELIPVPEPGPLATLGAFLLGAISFQRRRSTARDQAIPPAL